MLRLTLVLSGLLAAIILAGCTCSTDSGIVGNVDQLLIDRCVQTDAIESERREGKRFLTDFEYEAAVRSFSHLSTDAVGGGECVSSEH